MSKQSTGKQLFATGSLSQLSQRYYLILIRPALLLCLVLCLALFSLPAVSAEKSPVLALTPGLAAPSLLDYVDVLEDPELQLSAEQLCCNNAFSFTPLHRKHIDFGFSQSRFWLRLAVVNSSDANGEWILDLNTRFMNELHAYLVHDGELELIAKDSDRRPFSDRAMPHRHVTGSFTLKAGEKATLLIGYRSRGTTALPVSIESKDSFYREWIEDTQKNIGFYAAMLLMMAFGLFQFFILRSPVQLSYAGYVGAGLLYVFHMDGLSFQYLWPHWPQWNAAASTYLGLSINLFSITFARTFLSTRRTMPRFDRILLAALIITIAIMVLTALLDDRYFKQISFWITTSGTLLCFAAGIIAYLKGQHSARFYILGWCGLFIATFYISLSHWLPSEFLLPFSFDLTKLSILFDTLMFAMAMADQANDLRKERDAANQRERTLLERDLALHRKMYLLERQYEKALTVAQQKSLQLATAGHDLRQPIVALRLAMQKLYEQQNTDPTTVTQFRRGFDYIENLIRQFLESAQPTSSHGDETDVDEATPHSGDNENFPLQIIFDNIMHMFTEDATRKVLQLRCAPSSVQISANPVVLMRVVGNLVDNAIKYTAEGTVLLGCRRRPSGAEIQVIDTGPGISDAETDTLFELFQRGGNPEETSGFGLGLAIAAQLAQDNGWQLELRSLPRGTLARLQLYSKSVD